jgi:cysteine sulfinate desulfinase/cysteine desulfurase-like protein
LQEIKNIITDETVLLSVLCTQINEIGTIEPIAEIGQMLREINKTRKNRFCFIQMQYRQQGK